MKRMSLLLTCVALIATTAGCRCGGSIFNWRSSNDACCGPVESISPAVTTNYGPFEYEGPYESGSSIVSPSPAVEQLPPMSRP